MPTKPNITTLRGLAFWRAFFKLSPDKMEEYHSTAVYRANLWDQCACCALLKRRRIKDTSPGDAEPINQKLDILGREFNWDISSRSYPAAIRLFTRIQKMVREENRNHENAVKLLAHEECERIAERDELRQLLAACPSPDAEAVRKWIDTAIEGVAEAGRWGVEHVGAANYPERQREAMQNIEKAESEYMAELPAILTKHNLTCKETSK